MVKNIYFNPNLIWYWHDITWKRKLISTQTRTNLTQPNPNSETSKHDVNQIRMTRHEPNPTRKQLKLNLNLNPNNPAQTQPNSAHWHPYLCLHGENSFQYCNWSCQCSIVLSSDQSTIVNNRGLGHIYSHRYLQVQGVLGNTWEILCQSIKICSSLSSLKNNYGNSHLRPPLFYSCMTKGKKGGIIIPHSCPVTCKLHLWPSVGIN